MESWTHDIEFERVGPVRNVFRKLVINPLVNYLPASFIKFVLRHFKSELASANWDDPGGWKSMVISYDGNPPQYADKAMVSLSAMSMSLRNRKRLGARLIARLCEQVDRDKVYVLCLGAGPGRIIMDAMLETGVTVHSMLVDISSDAFEYGMDLAKKHNLHERIRYIQGDVRDIADMLDHEPDVVKMLGICEYLTDEQIIDIAKAVAKLMPDNSAIVFNSLTKNHGTERFFKHVFGLHMNHRSAEQLQQLMSQAGFGDYTTFTEPLGVYDVVVGKKLPA